MDVRYLYTYDDFGEKTRAVEYGKLSRVEVMPNPETGNAVFRVTMTPIQPAGIGGIASVQVAIAFEAGEVEKAQSEIDDLMAGKAEFADLAKHQPEIEKALEIKREFEDAYEENVEAEE